MADENARKLRSRTDAFEAAKAQLVMLYEAEVEERRADFAAEKRNIQLSYDVGRHQVRLFSVPFLTNWHGHQRAISRASIERVVAEAELYGQYNKALQELAVAWGFPDSESGCKDLLSL